MCAIAGFIHPDSRQLFPNISKMLATNIWRGPDATGHYIDGNLALGHHRLSIIDTNTRANQPMVRDHLTLIFNGEIYNFQALRQRLRESWNFTTQSDSEVILAAYNHWGQACVKEFNGDWAFAIHDRRKNQVFLSRDRFGIKPLYFGQQKQGYAFASEIRAILAVMPQTISDQSLLDLFMNRKCQTLLDTPFANIQTVPPGHNLVIPLGEPEEYKLQRYYGEHDIFSAEVPQNYDQAVEAFGAILEDAVRLRFIADVDVGVCLSGGLDSSLITAILAKLEPGKPINTFSGIAPGFESDESPYSNMMAQAAGVDHYPVTLRSTDVETFLVPYTKGLDAPITALNTLGRASVLNKAKQYVKVVLDGQGADEILTGYHRFHRTYQNKINGQFALRNSYDVRQKGMDLKNLLNVNRFGNLKPQKEQKVALTFKTDPVTQSQYQALTGAGLLSLLQIEDRFTMWNSMEGRVPFMDHRLVEFCMSSPLAYRINESEDKRLARSYARQSGIVPTAIIDRKDKLGFSSPYAHYPQVGEYLIQEAQNLQIRCPDIFSQTAITELCQQVKIDMSGCVELAYVISCSHYLANISGDKSLEK